MQESVWRKLIDAGIALHSELALPAVLRTLVDQAAVVTGARSSAAGVLGRSGDDVELSVGALGIEDHHRIGPRRFVGRGVAVGNHVVHLQSKVRLIDCVEDDSPAPATAVDSRRGRGNVCVPASRLSP